MTRRALIAVGFVAMVAAASPLRAHHSWPVDSSRAVTVSGTVTGYEWGNPHVMIGLDVKVENGSIEKWSVGGPSTIRMEANGWDKTTLKAGDVITATGHRFSDGQRILRLDKIVMAGGKEMFLYGRR
ncbi:MAG TPA: DUF6152 family protein [Vicinamibacterales bacterium]|nr:DUF6152 family protein [Vicinamibacterales bacterium]